MAIIAQGSFTVVDYNDAILVTSFLRTNTVKTVIYDPTAPVATRYNPSWSTGTFNEIWPVITKPKADGTGIEDITTAIDPASIKWFKTIGGVTTQILFSANGSKSTVLSVSSNDTTNTLFCENNTSVLALAPFGLRIKENKMAPSTAAIDYTFEAKYLDTNSNLWLDIKAVISYSMVQNGSNIAICRTYAISSDTFYNAVDTDTLQVGGDLLRGTSPDTTLSYQWYKMDNSVFAPTTVATSAVIIATKTVTVTSTVGMAVGGLIKVGAEAAHTIVSIVGSVITVDVNFSAGYAVATAITNPDYDVNAGIGWAKLANLANHFATVSGTSGTGKCALTVSAIEVASMQTFKCVIKDDESLIYYSDTISLFDTSDPIQVELFSPSGNVIKNGQGTVVISATVKRNGVVVTTKTDGTPFTINYRKLNDNGSADGTFGTAGVLAATLSITYASIAYPNAIQVPASQVTNKAIFICEIS